MQSRPLKSNYREDLTLLSEILSHSHEVLVLWLRFLENVTAQLDRENLTIEAAASSSLPLELVRGARERTSCLCRSTLALLQSTSVVVDQSSQTRVIYAATCPRVIAKDDEKVSSRATGFAKKHSSVIAVSCLFWTCSFFVALLVWFDVFESWLACALCVPCSIPIIVCVWSSFDRTLLVLLSRNFQILFIWTTTLAYCLSLMVLWRKHPTKVFCVIFGIPSFLTGSCMDASPESIRVSGSRLFFFLNLWGLVLPASGIVLGLSKFDDFNFRVSNTISVGAFTIMTSTVSSLAILTVEALVMSWIRTDALVVFKSNVVSVKMDKKLFHIMRMTSDMLEGEQRRGHCRQTTAAQSWPSNIFWHLKAKVTSQHT